MAVRNGRALGIVAATAIALGAPWSHGCGSSGLEAREPGEEELGDPLALVPEDSFAVLRVDARQLRQSPYAPTVRVWYDWLRGLGSELDDEEQAAIEVFDALYERTDLIVAGIAAPADPSSSDDPELVVVFRGSHADADVEHWLQRLAVGSRRVEVERRGDRKLIRLGEVTAVRVDAATWAFVLGPHLDSLLSRIETPRAGHLPGVLGQLEDQLGSEDAALAVHLELIPPMLEQADED